MSTRFSAFPSGAPPEDTDKLLITRVDPSSPTGFSNYLLTWAELKATIVSGGSSAGVPGLDGADGEDGMMIPGPRGANGSNGANGTSAVSLLLVEAENEEPLVIPGARGADGAAGPAGSNSVTTTMMVVDAEVEEPLLVPGPKGDTGATGGGGGGGLTLTAVTVDLGVAHRSGTFDITGLSGLTAGKPVLIKQLASAIPSKGDARDEFEMDAISLTGYVVDASTIRCYWNATGVVVGNYNFGYAVSN